MMRKDKNTIKNTKCQSKKNVCEMVNFDSTKLTKPKTILETQRNGIIFS